jgi:hypothetical protein
METLVKIKETVENLSVNAIKFFEKKNKSAGIRARKEAQTLKNLCQEFRKEILDTNK